MKKFSFLFCFIFTLNAHAGIFDCLKALVVAKPVGLTQKKADSLSKAIVKGNTRKIKKLARPVLVQDHGNIFSYAGRSLTYKNKIGIANIPHIKQNKNHGPIVHSIPSVIFLSTGLSLLPVPYFDYAYILSPALASLQLLLLAMSDTIELGGGIGSLKITATKGTGKLIVRKRTNDSKESFNTALKYIKANSQQLGIDRKWFNNRNIIIQDRPLDNPTSQTPGILSRIDKMFSRSSGDSASLASLVGIVSLMTNKPVKSNVSMTGAINSFGEVRRIGGVENKVREALMYGNRIIIPKGNLDDLSHLPEEFRNEPNVVAVESVEEALDIALEDDPIKQFKTNDLLLFAAHVAASSSPEADAIKNLKMLVEMGFDISIENESDKSKWIEFFWSYIGRSEILNQRQTEILNILIDAGLTAEELYFDDGQSPVHQSLLIGGSDKFKTILNSGLITRDNVDMKFYPRDFDSQRKYLGKQYDNTKTTLLHWIVGKKKNDRIPHDISPLIAMDADLDVTVDIDDEQDVYSPIGRTPLETAQKANNYLAAVSLLEAGANTEDFDINAKVSAFSDFTLLQQAWYEYVYQDKLYYSTNIGIEPIETLISFGASLHVENQNGKTLLEDIKSYIRTARFSITHHLYRPFKELKKLKKLCNVQGRL